MFINANIYISTFLMFSGAVGWLSSAEHPRKHRLHSFHSFILTAVYDLQWKDRLKVGKVAPTACSRCADGGVIGPATHCSFRRSHQRNLRSLSFTQEKDELTGLLRGMKREGERGGEKGERREHVKWIQAGPSADTPPSPPLRQNTVN